MNWGPCREAHSGHNEHFSPLSFTYLIIRYHPPIR
uniref:Uncharacterized protein n=1 Tax=Anguilla anguilla TaxID=7936 RepID=A0A0E9UKG7_ANGAN